MNRLLLSVSNLADLFLLFAAVVVAAAAAVVVAVIVDAAVVVVATVVAAAVVAVVIVAVVAAVGVAVDASIVTRLGRGQSGGESPRVQRPQHPSAGEGVHQ